MYDEVVLTKSDRISQKTLQQLNELRQIIAAKKKQASQLKKEADKLKYEETGLHGELIDLLNQGHKVSRGRFMATLKIIESLPRLAWKQVFIKFVPDGEAKAEKLMAEREPDRSQYVEILVRE